MSAPAASWCCGSHEIKHDGFRVIARKDGDRVRFYSRLGNDMTRRFPLIAESLARLRPRSCIIDGEAVACDENGIASFNRIRYRNHDDTIFLEIATRSLRRKMARSPSRAGGRRTRLQLTGRGRNHPSRRGSFLYDDAQLPPRDTTSAI
jgi:ATP dependent DNA ligase domain